MIPMKDKKPISQREARKEAQRYKWHFEPPWAEKFNHDHWWVKNPKEATLIAALWEMFRRHPDILPIIDTDRIPTSLFQVFAENNWFKNWLQLTASNRNDWREALVEIPPQCGFDPRPIYSITLQSVHHDHVVYQQACMAVDPQLIELAKTDEDAKRILDKSIKRREEEIERLAVKHHRAGRVLIAINPDISDLEEATRALTEYYKAHRRYSSSGADHKSEWLESIKSFERNIAELKRGENINANLFTSYRRTLGKLVFPLGDILC